MQTTTITIDGREVRVGGPRLLSDIGAVEMDAADAWRRDGAGSRIAGPVFFRWMARQGDDREPTEGELLSFALEHGMLNLAPGTP